jgi:hypothetical protein
MNGTPQLIHDQAIDRNVLDSLDPGRGWAWWRSAHGPMVSQPPGCAGDRWLTAPPGRVFTQHGRMD